MNKILLALVAIAILIGAIFYSSPSANSHYQYPGSELIFKKYYPENEILGMANDKNWHEVDISNDPIEAISMWYEKKLSAYTLVENNTDERCSKKSWQDGKLTKLRLTICNQDNYRTILYVFP